MYSILNKMMLYNFTNYETTTSIISQNMDQRLQRLRQTRDRNMNKYGRCDTFELTADDELNDQHCIGDVWCSERRPDHPKFTRPVFTA